MIWVSILGALVVGYLLGRRARTPIPESSSGDTTPPASHEAGHLLDGLEDGVLACDPDGEVTLINMAARQMLACTNAVVGQPLTSISLGEELVLARPARAGLVEAKEMLLDGGRVVAIRVQVRPDRSIIYVLHDITELRQMDKVRRDFVANVSHELRTPVSVIRANAETLLDGALDDEDVARDFVSAVHRNAERLSNLVSDLLDLARIEGGSMTLDREPLALDMFVAQTMSAVGTLAESKHITLHNEVSAGTQCLGDPGAMEQVLTNFIANAVKYGVDGGNVWVRAYPVVGRVRIEIIDDGVGVPGKHRSRLFERFYRVDTGRSRAAGGTGLGLAIVKHLVNGMGGRVGMEANHPEGSVFWFSIPIVETAPV